MQEMKGVIGRGEGSKKWRGYRQHFNQVAIPAMEIPQLVLKKIMS